MRLRNVKNKEDIIRESSSCILLPQQYKGKWKDVFENDHPIHVEIGMGKGKFIIEKALRYPNINFIGIEKYDSVIARALEKIKEPLPNLRMIRMNALLINEAFGHEIDCIYLNFSDPWPKARHHLRRLTSITFLKKYDFLFREKAIIIQKTDNLELFRYSLLSFNNYGYHFDELSFDLYKDNVDTNISTEYEDRFVKLNKPIYYLQVSKCTCKLDVK